MSAEPKSGVRAVTVLGHARAILEDLRAHRAHLAELTKTVDAAIEGMEALAEAIAPLEQGASDRGEAVERARLLSLGRRGQVVLSVADRHHVPLRRLLGPGSSGTPEAARAREDAAVALRREGLSEQNAGKVLRLSQQTIGNLLVRAAKRSKAVA